MNYFKQFCVSAVLLLTGTLATMGQTISPADAKAKAQVFLKKSNKMQVSATNAQPMSLAYTSKSGDETYYYVFNNQAGGFVIIGGDEASQEILGYSNSGTFDYDKLPDNMKWFLSCYDQQISSAIKQVKEGKATPAKSAPRKTTKANISTLMATRWDQVAPYNSQIPLNQQDGFSGEYALATGCVATAGAQIMKYHNWPDTGVGSHTLGTKYNGLTFSADFANTTYDWTNMHNSYTYDTYTGSAADIAVGTLMYHVGVAVDMQYGQIRSGGSGAVARNLAKALVENFKYSKGITYHSRAYYTDEQWEDMVYNELAEHRPVLYGGQQENSGSGHSFVCDGYADGLYHINWGWSGQYDGNFLLTSTSTGTALCPNGSGTGGGTAGDGYYMNQEIGIGIAPDTDGTSQPVKSAFTQGITLVTSTTTPGGNISIDGYYCGNSSMVPQAYNLKMKFTNTADPSDVIIGTYTRTTRELASGYSESSTEPFIAPYTLEPGQSYYVTMMYQNSDGEYVDMPQPQNWESQVLEVTEPTGVVLSKELVIDNGGYLSMNYGEVHFSLKNYDAQTGQIPYLYIYVFEGGSSKAYWLYRPATFEAGEEIHYSLNLSQLTYGKDKLVEGNDYEVAVYNSNTGEFLSPSVPFHLCNELPINYTLTTAEWGTLCLPYSAEVPTGLTAYTVTETDGNLLVKEETDKLEMNKPYLVTGTPDTYRFNGPDTPQAENLKNGLLVGNTTAAQTFAPQGSYVLQNLPAKNGLAFYKVAADGTQRVRQYGAYLDANSGTSATSFFKFCDDESTGITTVDQDEKTTPAYNLNGIRVSRNTRGLVIVNGKLYFNK